ncbi:MAG: gamma carbonic anhydrase family protein [Bacteroidota bacterium]|nr:gamma carbonic anhydrase family protein [Bacteroidota bacterium]
MSRNARIIPYCGRMPVIHPSAFIADGAVIAGDVTIAENVNVWFNAVIRGDVHTITIGARTNVQDNCTLHVTTDTHPLVIGSDVTVGHNAVLHGCTVEDGALIGMNATVLDGAVIGEGALVAAGSLVRQNARIPPHSLAAGVPAKVVRLLSDEERRGLASSAAHYVEVVDRYRTHRDLERGMDFASFRRDTSGTGHATE